MSHGLQGMQFLTVAEVADTMRVSRMTVYRLVHSGQLPAIRFGRSFRVPESAVLTALSTPGVLAAVAQEPMAEAPAPGAQPGPARLADSA